MFSTLKSCVPCVWSTVLRRLYCLSFLTKWSCKVSSIILHNRMALESWYMSASRIFFCSISHKGSLGRLHKKLNAKVVILKFSWTLYRMAWMFSAHLYWFWVTVVSKSSNLQKMRSVKHEHTWYSYNNFISDNPNCVEREDFLHRSHRVAVIKLRWPTCHLLVLKPLTISH